MFDERILTLYSLKNEDFFIIILEFITLLFAIGATICVLVILKKYRDLTRKGFRYIVFGFICMINFALFELLDSYFITYSFKIYFDYLDAIFLSLGLLAMAYGFIRISIYLKNKKESKL